LALEQLAAGVEALDPAGVPGQGQGVADGLAVLADAGGERVQVVLAGVGVDGTGMTTPSPPATAAGPARHRATATAATINRTLANRDGPIVPLIAETGGVNAMVVDATALPEQVVDDAITSAFTSAGQRCSALRVLYLQEEIADRVIGMLAGVPLGIATGRFLWARFASELYVVPQPVISMVTVAAVAAPKFGNALGEPACTLAGAAFRFKFSCLSSSPCFSSPSR